jgi:hypothetical protein
VLLTLFHKSPDPMLHQQKNRTNDEDATWCAWIRTCDFLGHAAQTFLCLQPIATLTPDGKLAAFVVRCTLLAVTSIWQCSILMWKNQY